MLISTRASWEPRPTTQPLVEYVEDKLVGHDDGGAIERVGYQMDRTMRAVARLIDALAERGQLDAQQVTHILDTYESDAELIKP